MKGQNMAGVENDEIERRCGYWSCHCTSNARVCRYLLLNDLSRDFQRRRGKYADGVITFRVSIVCFRSGNEKDITETRNTDPLKERLYFVSSIVAVKLYIYYIFLSVACVYSPWRPFCSFIAGSFGRGFYCKLEFEFLLLSRRREQEIDKRSRCLETPRGNFYRFLVTRHVTSQSR